MFFIIYFKSNFKSTRCPSLINKKSHFESVFAISVYTLVSEFVSAILKFNGVQGFLYIYIRRKMFDFGNINATLITLNTCRMCLKNIGSISIYECIENNESLAEMLTFITSLTVRNILFSNFSLRISKKFFLGIFSNK